MLADISVAEVKRIAKLADAARSARDAALKVRPKDVKVEPPPVRGEHEAAEGFGFEPLLADHPVLTALRDAIAALSDDERNELRALCWIGRGEYAAGNWDEAVSAAAAETRDASVGALQEEVDLHHFLTKALYELERA
jgi:hypothetical protein